WIRSRDAGHRGGIHDRRSVVARTAGDGWLRRGDPDVHGRVALRSLVVAAPRRRGYVLDRGVRAPRREADFLGPAVAALPCSRRSARTRVGGARRSRHRAGRLRHGPQPRPRPGRYRDGAVTVAPRDAMTSPFTLELGLGALLLLTFVWNL